MRTLLTVLFIVSAFAVPMGIPSDHEETTRRSNVLLIVIDTLRADALGCNGHEAANTPAIDAFAAESVQFTDAVSSSGWTLPSVGSLLTGVWPSLHKATGKLTLLRPISPDVPTAAELLVDEGYTTLGFANAAFLSPLLGLDRGFEVFDHKHAYNQDDATGFISLNALRLKANARQEK